MSAGPVRGDEKLLWHALFVLVLLLVLIVAAFL